MILTIVFLLIFVGAIFLFRASIIRYGWKNVLFVAGGTLLMGIVVTFVSWWILFKDFNKVVKVDVNWKYLASFEGETISFKYQPDTGLYVVDGSGAKTLITSQWPFCIRGGEIENKEPQSVHVIGSIPIYFVSPHQKAIANINFEFCYSSSCLSPEETETGYSSFVWFRSGEIWCIEKIVPGSPEGLAGINLYALGAYVIGFRNGLIAFLLSAIVFSLLLEIYYQKERKQVAQ